MHNIKLTPIAAMLGLIFIHSAFAATTSSISTNDDFTQPADTNNWTALNDACLTAGTTSTVSNIPGCGYSPPDVAGSGALRLNPAAYSQSGAIIFNNTFPSTKGLQITFTTYSYGGDSGGAGKDGADGMSFFLTDGGGPTAINPAIPYTPVPTVTGGLGGSLGYSCSNSNSRYDGLSNGYLGLGMDEYGNFLNNGDNTSTGMPTNNTMGGSGNYQPNRIGLRGSGNVNWQWLSANYSGLYSGTESKKAVTNTCRTGLLQNGASGTLEYPVTAMTWTASSSVAPASGLLTLTTATANLVAPGNIVTITANSSGIPTSGGNSIVGTYVVQSVNTAGPSFTIPFSGSSVNTNASDALVAINVADYAAIPNGYLVLPPSLLIANESTSTRTAAIPITYRLIITPSGLLTFMYSYNGTGFLPVLTNQPLNAFNGSLPASFRFGFSGSTGGSDNIHEISCFSAQSLQSASSAAANTVQAGQVQSETQIYLAGYSTNNWWGSLAAYPLSISGSVVSVNTTATWDGGCILTGGSCAATGATATAETPANRVLLTVDGSSAGIPLEAANITTSQLSTLNSTDSNGTIRLDWLRGGRTNEQSFVPAGILRARTSVLGDILNSGPVWVGAPVLTYSSPFVDALYPAASQPENAAPPAPAPAAQTYTAYAANNYTRLNVVYSGSNDGFVHGFEAGANNASGSLTPFDSTLNDGKEVIGFMPASVLANSNVVGLTSPTYGHNYFVDAAPSAGDLFYNNAWHTWLVGGLGAGGSEIYALDISNPASSLSSASGPVFAEANASTLVVGDWSNTSLTKMGNTFGTPIIRRLHNGQWAIIFGNGYGSGGHAGIYIGLVNSTGVVTYQFLDTLNGSSTSPNGIAFVSSVDLDGDHVVDYLYAGDLLGNVWRFDLTSSAPADWHVSVFGGTTPAPLFTSISAQPITTGITVAASYTGGANRVMVMFGTGQKTPGTFLNADTYLTGSQYVYGIWDYNMDKWDNGTTTVNAVVIPASTAKYASLSAPQTNSQSVLLSQSVASTVAGTGAPVLGYRSVSNTNKVCWQGTSTCSSPSLNNQFGWYFTLPGTNEQIVYSPTLVSGALVVNTTIPPLATSAQCNLHLSTGWSMAFDVASGGGLPQGFFQDSTGSYAASGTGSSQTTVMGAQLNGVGSPYTVSVGNNTYLAMQTSNGTPQIPPVNPQNGISVHRVTWEELR